MSIIKHSNSFFEIIHNGIQTDQLTESLDDLIGIQEKLFDFGLTMSGFQFVGLILENSVTHLETQYKVAYFILSIGFILSLFGSLLSYITFKYLRSIKLENSEFVVQGMNKYYKFFMLSYIVPFGNCVLFMIPLNILIYNILEYYYGIIFNILSIILLIIGISMHQIIIVNKQEYKSNSNTIKRRFTSYMTE